MKPRLSSGLAVDFFPYQTCGNASCPEAPTRVRKIEMVFSFARFTYLAVALLGVLYGGAPSRGGEWPPRNTRNTRKRKSRNALLARAQSTRLAVDQITGQPRAGLALRLLVDSFSFHTGRNRTSGDMFSREGQSRDGFLSFGCFVYLAVTRLDVMHGGWPKRGGEGPPRNMRNTRKRSRRKASST